MVWLLLEFMVPEDIAVMGAFWFGPSFSVAAEALS